MNTKAFLLLLAAVLVLGGGLGGAFAGGVALGKSQGDDKVAPNSTPTTLGPEAQDELSDQPGQSQLDQLRQRFQSGELTRDELAERRRQLQEQFGADAGGQRAGFAGPGRGLTGTIEKIEGARVTVNTPQGPIEGIVGADTTIQSFSEGTVTSRQVV